MLTLAVAMVGAVAQSAPANASEYVYDRGLYAEGAYGINAVPGGDYYTAAWGSNRVERHSGGGYNELLSSFGGTGAGDGQFNQPWGITTDATGAIYVADTQNNRIQKFTAAGNFVTKWGTAGTGNGQFNVPRDVDVDAAGYVYVTDSGNNRVQKFDSAGSFIAAWGSTGSGNGQLNLPSGIAVGAGVVYVGDSVNHRIQKFGSNGAFLGKWGTGGSGPGQFSNNIDGLDLDAAGNVYAAHNQSGSGVARVQKFSASGTLLDTINGDYPVTDLSVGDADSLLLANQGGGAVRYVHAGRLTFELYGTGPVDFTVGGGVSPSTFALGGSSNPYSRSFLVGNGSYPVSTSSTVSRQTAASCSDGSDPANVSVSLGEDVTCTYTFTRLPELIVEQFVQPTDGTDITFNAGGGLSPSTFQLDYDGSDSNALSSKRSFASLEPGSGYSVSQVPPPGWAAAHQVACSDGSPPSNISLSLGEVVTCKFQSHPPTAGFAGFQIDSQPDGLGAHFTGLPFPVDIDDSPSTGTPNVGGMWVNAGTYAMKQDFVSGWNLTSATCSDGSPVWAAQVNPEEFLICTWVNQQAPTGRVIVRLVDDPPYSGSFGFTAGGGLNQPQYPPGFTLFRLDPEEYPNHNPEISSKLFQVAPGSGYTVSENVPSGWEVTSASCDDGSPVSNISVSSGETVTCTFSNRKLGSLKIIQDTQPNDPHDFSYNVTGGLSPPSFLLDDDGDDGNGAASSRTFSGIQAGTYSVTQAAEPSWNRFFGLCSDGSPLTSIAISPGESVTCHLANTPLGQPQPTTSIGTGGTKANGSSSNPAISANGLIAFWSNATNLSAEDTNSYGDVYSRNLKTGDVRLVSRATGLAGPVGNRDSNEASLSADGRFVAFTSSATNLDPADPDTYSDVYVRDLALSTTTLVSRATGAGVKGSNSSFSPRISANGRHVAFVSWSTNLDPADPDTTPDVYVRDLQTNTTTLVSRATGSLGAKGNGSSSGPLVSDDGRVAFGSVATNLDPADTDTGSDVFLRDPQASTTLLVSRATGASGAKGNSFTYPGSISADGRYVSLSSNATNLDAADTNNTASAYLRDLQLNTTELISRAQGASGASATGNSAASSVSPDGRYVTFLSYSGNLDPTVPTAETSAYKAYVRDRQAGTTGMRSLQTGAQGAVPNDSLSAAVTSDDGRYTAFHSYATNLSQDHTGPFSAHVYVRDSQTNVTSLEDRASPTYARAKAATPFFAPLVPAYQTCGSPNRVHATPLSFGSCSPPGRSSPRLTAGSPDANGAAANLVASVKLRSVTEALPLDPNNGDQSDVALDVSVTDVRNSGSLSDYTGELEARIPLRVTDRVNFPVSGGMGPGTTQGFSISATVPCTATGATTVGSTCTLSTSADALVPGTVIESSRGVWALGQISVYDGGADSDGDTTGDNEPFLRQGVFVP